jgi:hypothetical protein
MKKKAHKIVDAWLNRELTERAKQYHAFFIRVSLNQQKAATVIPWDQKMIDKTGSPLGPVDTLLTADQYGSLYTIHYHNDSVENIRKKKIRRRMLLGETIAWVLFPRQMQFLNYRQEQGGLTLAELLEGYPKFFTDPLIYKPKILEEATRKRSHFILRMKGPLPDIQSIDIYLNLYSKDNIQTMKTEHIRDLQIMMRSVRIWNMECRRSGDTGEYLSPNEG